MILVGTLLFPAPASAASSSNEHPWWEFQSIDTMKYSRDPSRSITNDPDFDQIIEKQVRDIAETGATHVGIATPYDEEFLPVLRRWVTAARRHDLKVWFRGNFSGWEGWFGYPRITRAQHLISTREFLQKNEDLFEEGDLFSACPECENGGPGDPRLNGDPEGHKKFLIEEYRVTREAFHRMGKNVQSNLHSMNGDVARLIMDEQTTAALGGIVTIDHYVHTPEKLAADIQEIAKKSKGKVILGEYGAPIPDIHGNQSPEEQAAWIQASLSKLATLPELIGVNYWVSVGGSTRLWNDDGTARPAAAELKKYFTPFVISGKIANSWNTPIKNAKISSTHKTVYTNSQGKFNLPALTDKATITVEAPGYAAQTLQLSAVNTSPQIDLLPQNPGLIYRFRVFFQKVITFFKG